MEKRYTARELKELVIALCLRCDVPPKDAALCAEVLLAAEMRGIPSHGLLRLNDYVRMLRSGRIRARCQPQVVHETLSTGTIDGDNGLGPVVSVFAMQKAMAKARESGSGWMAVRNSNHFGIAGYYAMMALPKQMIGLCMCNANPLVAPTFSASGMLGTNPLAVAVPAGKELPLVADFATAAIARGKVDLLHKQGQSIETGFVQEADGTPSRDPGVLTRGGAILPLGSSRQYGSHKGYCMASLIDIFSALLPAANFGPFVPPSVDWLPVKEKLPGMGTGHFFGAFRIDAFRPDREFRESMDHWIRTMKAAPPAKGFERVLVPGEPEWEAEKYHKDKGISLREKVKEQVEGLCRELDVRCPF